MLRRPHVSILRLDGGEEAQSIIELAIISAVLLIILLGVVDFARIMYYQTALESAARVGAEMASGHCEMPVNCGSYGAPTSYDFILQAVECDASDVPLQPSVPCTRVNTVGASPCSGSCPPACSQDVCVSPAYPPGTTAPLTSAEDVTVTVGYDFAPITSLISPFLQSDANPAWKNGCWPGDPPHTHTLCAQYTGRIQ